MSKGRSEARSDEDREECDDASAGLADAIAGMSAGGRAVSATGHENASAGGHRASASGHGPDGASPARSRSSIADVARFFATDVT